MSGGSRVVLGMMSRRQFGDRVKSLSVVPETMSITDSGLLRPLTGEFHREKLPFDREIL